MGHRKMAENGASGGVFGQLPAWAAIALLGSSQGVQFVRGGEVLDSAAAAQEQRVQMTEILAECRGQNHALEQMAIARRETLQQLDGSYDALLNQLTIIVEQDREAWGAGVEAILAKLERIEERGAQ